MGFLDRLKSLDILSTPPAPKKGSVPLPEVDRDLYSVALVVARDDNRSTGSDCTPSPDSPLSPVIPSMPRRRKESLLSRSSTAQRGSRETIPPRPLELIAPTPRRKTAPLSEQGWRNVSPEPELPKKRSRTHSMQYASRPSTTRPYRDERSTSPEDLKAKPRSITPQVPSRASTSRWSERSESPEILKKKPLSSSPKSPFRPSSSRPSTTTLCDDEPPQTPSLETPLTRSVSRSTERRMSASSTKRPLKGILKATRPTPVDAVALRELEQRGASPSPPSTPIPLPLEHFGLHWQLLPPNPALGKHLRFDVALPVNEIRKYNNRVPLALGVRDWDKPVVEGLKLTRMTIRCAQSRQWTIVVKNPKGITCGDVFDEIHDTFNTPLTDAERELYVTGRKRTRIEDAFAQRCKDAPGLSEWVRQQGLKRIDLLQGKRIFAGLSLVEPDRCDLWEMSIE